MNITFRLAKPIDALKMADIHCRSWEAAYKGIIPENIISEKNATRIALFQRIITNENNSYYIIENNHLTVGFISIAPSEDEDADDNVFEIYAIYLDPSYFRLGIGSKAMEFAIEKSRLLNKKAIAVWLLEENKRAFKFYRKFDFVADGKEKAYNCGKEMKIIRMKKTL